MCVSPVAYVVLCVRFASLVRICSSRNHLQRSAGHATLDTGGWLDLARQGLSPCKMRQASLAALTMKANRLVCPQAGPGWSEELGVRS